MNVSAEQVQAAIPKDGALIGYLWYEHYLGKDRFENKVPVSIRLTGLKLRCSASTVPNACDRDDLVSVVNPVNEAVRTDDGFADKGAFFSGTIRPLCGKSPMTSTCLMSSSPNR